MDHEDAAIEVAGMMAEMPQQADARNLIGQLRGEVQGRGGKVWNLFVYMATHPAAVAKLFSDAADGNYLQAIRDFIADWRAANPMTAPQD